MSDARLSTLRRAWQKTGTDEDRLAYLRERGRTGVASPIQRLELPGLSR